jgi:diaminopimelate epimerase
VTVPFVKMHGAGNDFVVVDRRARALPEPLASWVARVCDRRRGVGADGVLLLEPDPELDFAMAYYNADGGRAEFCGNGARCVARFALDLGLGGGGAVRFRTDAGPQRAMRGADGRIALGFGRVAGAAPGPAVEAAGRRFEGVSLRPGVPHYVVEVAAVAGVPVAEWGAALRRHAAFGPAGTNVDFVAALGSDRVAMRTFERGVEAETLACGSGAIAAALWAAGRGAGSPVRVLTAGGDELEVAFDAAPGGWDVTLTGPAEVAFRGEWTDGPAAGDGRGGRRTPCSRA